MGFKSWIPDIILFIILIFLFVDSAYELGYISGVFIIWIIIRLIWNKFRKKKKKKQ